MTQEEKDILLKDLCARLPYGVNVDIKYSKLNGSSLRLKVCSEGMLPLNTDLLDLFQEEEICLKPYLRPMSSMTEDECKILGSISATLENKLIEVLPNTPYYIEVAVPNQIDWLNKNMFDYRGLIPMGLALEALEGMYNVKEG